MSGINRINAIRKITLACSQQKALPFIWDIKNIEFCEVKADKVQVKKESDRSGTYIVEGHFARYIPWTRKFSYQLHPKGFHSTEAMKPVSVFDIQGGFIVEVRGEEECEIIHYEQYRLPLHFLPLKPLIYLYLKWSQGKELKDLKDLILKNTRAAA